MKANAVPSSGDEERAGEVAPEVAVHRHLRRPQQPPPISAMPGAITSFAEPRVTSACERPANATEVSDAASQASPVCSAE